MAEFLLSAVFLYLSLKTVSEKTMSLKLVTEKAFTKWCKDCRALISSEHGGPSVAIMCNSKNCIYQAVRQRRLAGMAYDEDEIAAIIGCERIEKLKAKAMPENKKRGRTPMVYPRGNDVVYLADFIEGGNELERKSGLRKFEKVVAKIRYSPQKTPTRLKDDALDYLRRLELLRHGVSCKKKSLEECETLAAIKYDFICDPSKAADFSLHDFPKKMRGEAAEILVCLKLLEYSIRCETSEKSYEDKLAFPAFEKNAKRTPLQVKSVSLKKHGYEISVDDTPLEMFKGWYIILIEHEPKDFLLFAPSDDIKRRFKEKGFRHKEGKVRPHLKRRHLYIPADLDDSWSGYLDSMKFIEDIHQE